MIKRQLCLHVMLHEDQSNLLDEHILSWVWMVLRSWLLVTSGTFCAFFFLLRRGFACILPWERKAPLPRL
jgi:hypothetical protein